ncbi:MAG: hypothetical protein OEW19_15775, partial [Acidobacteriota bacterium]|nr:hypothetical protein [Acidobacteriota bacterium]
PNNDWEIEANSNLSGGLNYLGFNDCGSADNDGGCADDLVFAVEAGTRASALYVEDDGDVGIGTSLPVLDLHIVTGDTPSLRLDQDGSSGFAPQVWDIAGNETNFFVRDVTAGSLLPLRIRPGAPTSSIDIMASGVVMKNGLIVEAPCSGCDSIFEPGRRLASIEEHAALMRSNRYLPGVGPTPDGLVALNVPEKITGILQELEIAHIYIEQLHAHLREVQERLATLEARQRGGAGGGT